MYSRPLLPFRARPLRETTVRPSPLRRNDPGDGGADGEQPSTIRAARRPVKAQTVLTPQSTHGTGDTSGRD